MKTYEFMKKKHNKELYDKNEKPNLIKILKIG